MSRTRTLAALALPLLLLAGPGVPARAELVGQVGFDKQVFNPTKGEAISIQYVLAETARVTLAIHDPDGRVVRELVSGVSQTPGLHMVAWDGKDAAGMVVPDEAYYPTLRAEGGSGALTLDPTTDSGGELLSGVEANYEPARGVVRYVLPQTARVRILAGVDDGPLLATVVPNVPRVAGLCEEPWDGMDSSGVLTVPELAGWRLRVEAALLPRWALIAQGNEEKGFVEYTLAAMSKDREKGLPPGHTLVALARTPRPAGQVRLSPFASQSRILDQPPQFAVKLADADGPEVPVVGRDPEVEVALEPLTAALLNEVRFEVVYYLNFQRLGEEEQGYSPMRFVLPTADLPAGRHWLTINVASLTGQLGSQTMQIEITD